VRDGERQHRAEREHPREEVEVGAQDEAERDQGGDRDRHVRGAVGRVEAAEEARDLAVGDERVGQPRDPEHVHVDGLQQDQRADRAHDVAHRVHEPRGVVGGDDPQHGRLHERAGQVGAAVHHGHRHQGDNGDPDVDGENRRGGHEHEPPQRAPPDADLAGQARGGLDPGESDGGDHGRERKVAPLRRRAELDRVQDQRGVEEQREPDRDDGERDDEVREADARHEPEVVGG